MYIYIYIIPIHLFCVTQAPNKQYAPEWKIAKIFTGDHWEEPPGKYPRGEGVATPRLGEVDVE